MKVYLSYSFPLYRAIAESLEYRSMSLRHLPLNAESPPELQGLHGLLRQPNLNSIQLDCCIRFSTKEPSFTSVETITHTSCDNRTCEIGNLVSAYPNLQNLRFRIRVSRGALTTCGKFSRKLWLRGINSVLLLGALKNLEEPPIEESTLIGQRGDDHTALPPNIRVFELRGAEK